MDLRRWSGLPPGAPLFATAIYHLVGGGTGEDGLDLIRALLWQAASRLSPEGLLLMEFGFGQAEAVSAAANATAGIETIEVLRDLQGHERTLVARRAEAEI